jgi:DNA-binding transcriptional ArsR family regulator
MFNHININENNTLEDALKIISALSDKTRQEIIMLFYIQPEACVTDIAKNFKLSRPTISHHLNLMKRAKILNMRKEGKGVYYSFNKKYVIGVLESLIKVLDRCC